jgi:hypothetical protein
MDDVASSICLNMDFYCKCWSPIVVLHVIINLSSRKRREQFVIVQPVSRHCNSLTYSRLHKRRQGQRWSLSGGIIEQFFFSLYIYHGVWVCMLIDGILGDDVR